MAGDPIDSDSSVGSKRRINSDTEQDQETLQLSSPLPEITPSHHNHTQDSTPQEEAIMSDSSPKKKAKCFSLLHEGNQELGLHSSTEKNAFLSGSLDKEKIDNAETKEGSFGVQEVDSQINAIQDVDLGFDEKRAIKEKASESENVLEAEKKRLLGDLEVGKIFGAETCHTNISGSSMNSSKIEFDLPVRGSLKIEVIDDTALIGLFPLSRTGNGSVKNEKKGKEEIDGKKAKKSRRKGKNAKKVFAEPVNHTEPTKMVEVQRCKKESNSQSKIMYSRKELEALRYAKVGEQRKLWRDVYSGLGNDVIREYEGLGSWKNQKKINWSFDHRFGRQAASPATLGMILSLHSDACFHHLSMPFGFSYYYLLSCLISLFVLHRKSPKHLFSTSYVESDCCYDLMSLWW